MALRLAPDGSCDAPRPRVGHRHRGQQRLRVRMQRIVEQFVAVGEFDDAAEIHHRDALAEMPHHREIVRDEQIGQAELLAQILEQVHHLRLDRYIKRRHRFVADDELGVQRKRARNADALALASRHFMRVAIAEARIQATDRQKFAHACGALRGVRLDAVHLDRFADDVAHLHAGIERAVRVLEYHLDTPAQRQQFLALHAARCRRRRTGFRPRSAAPAEGCSGPSWSCRSRSRQQGRAFRRGGR